MRKTTKIIILIILTLIVLLFLRGGKENREDINNNPGEVTPPAELETNQSYSVDFANCSDKDDFTMATNLGTGSLKVIKSENGFCDVETTYEVEGGFYTNECRVPQSVGTMEFTDDNFESISSYCQLKTQGGGMLDLKK